MKKAVVVFGSVIAGNYLAERFVLKASPEDPTGFVQVADGLGMDDVARAATILLVVWLGDKVVAGIK
jgi:hypothetical protein